MITNGLINKSSRCSPYGRLLDTAAFQKLGCHPSNLPMVFIMAPIPPVSVVSFPEVLSDQAEALQLSEFV